MKRIALLLTTLLSAICYGYSEPSHLPMVSTYSETSQDDVEGVVLKEYKKDIYVIETRRFYVIVEWYRGRLWEGDKVVGELHRYGKKEIYNEKRDCEVTVYVEEYYTSWDDVVKWLKKKGAIE